MSFSGAALANHSIVEHFEAVLARHGSAPDEAQRNAALHLDRLTRALRARPRAGALAALARWLRRDEPTPPLGVYLFGGVGRGKTLLLDLFAEQSGLRVRRSHFHRFMHDVHSRLKVLREPQTSEPIQRVAQEIAADIAVLCFDELYVNDIADAMILGSLFEALHAAGVTFVFTSNVPPSGLYRNGLQRERFLPTIALLERITERIEVDAGIDYRLRRLTVAPVFSRTGPDSDATLARRFETLTMGPAAQPCELEIEGRPIAARGQHAGVAWFDFHALCDGPRGTDDYIAIARQFDTVLISNVPEFRGNDDAARRFIALIDEFYERAVKVLLSSAVAIEDLYRGERLTFEFRRTVSRLTEMQSTDYLAVAHRP